MNATAVFRTTPGALLFAASLGVSACDRESPTEPINTSLVGVWNLVGFTSDGESAVSEGTWVFFEDGFMAMDLQFQFPNQKTSLFAGTGHFEQAGDRATLEIRGRPSTWRLEFTADTVHLRQTSPAPANTTLSLGRI